MIDSYIHLIPNDIEQTDAVAFGITIKPILARDSVIELDVVATKTNVSNDFNIVVSASYFLYFFLDLWFLSLKYVIISLILLIWLLKQLASFNFFLVFVQDQCFQVVQMGIVYCSI